MTRHYGVTTDRPDVQSAAGVLSAALRTPASRYGGNDDELGAYRTAMSDALALLGHVAPEREIDEEEGW